MTNQEFTDWPLELSHKYKTLGYWTNERLDSILYNSKYTNQLAIVSPEENRSLSYGELLNRSWQIAIEFEQKGIKKDDKILLHVGNRISFFECFFAAIHLGAIPIMCLPAHKKLEIHKFAKHTEAKLYIGRPENKPLIEQLPSSINILIDGALDNYPSLSQKTNKPNAADPRSDLSANDVALLQLSGGSTSIPKLIPRTHKDYLYSIKQSIKVCNFNENTVYLSALPVQHNFSLSSPGALGALLAGGTVVLAARPQPSLCFSLIEKYKVTVTAVVPPLAILWLESPQSHSLQTLQTLQVGGAKLNENAAKRITPKLGCKLQQVFGMAEGLVCYTRFDDDNNTIVTTQGRPMSEADEIKIVDELDQEVEEGQTGHLLTRGPYTIQGYFKAPEHNTKAFTADGFYRTGDMVRKTSTGHLIVEGRSKDVINRGGEKIACDEIENLLLAHPEVIDSAIVGYADTFMGEKSCAFVVSKESTLSKGQILKFLRDQGLASYKIPDKILFVDDLPKTSLGKVSKQKLKDQLQTQLGII